MNIVVFIKEIPLSNNVQIDPKTNNLIRTNQEGRINPYDMHAIEAALELKEKYNATVRLVSMGPEGFKSSLREGLAMGCDEAYLLSSRTFAGSDTLATAYTLSQAVRKMGDVDFMLFGLKAIDADTGQVGPLVAESLKVPQITNAVKIENIDQKASTIDVSRLTETHVETVHSSYPLVISVDESINTPRYMSPLKIKNIMKQEITVWDEHDLACDIEKLGMKGSPTIVTDTYIPKDEGRKLTLLEGTPAEAAETLVNILKEKHVL